MNNNITICPICGKMIDENNVTYDCGDYGILNNDNIVYTECYDCLYDDIFEYEYDSDLVDIIEYIGADIY